MWVNQSAIRPIPPYAKVHPLVIELVRDELLTSNEDIEGRLDRAFEGFERSQPILAQRVGEVLEGPLGEAAVALGFFLTLSVWMAFDRAHGSSQGMVSQAGFDSTSELVKLDQKLRQDAQDEALETDDVIAMEQPAIMRFIHEQMTTTLEIHSASIEAEHLARVYRTILVEILALSYAVKVPKGYSKEAVEVLA